MRPNAAGGGGGGVDVIFFPSVLWLSSPQMSGTVLGGGNEQETKQLQQPD